MPLDPVKWSFQGFGYPWRVFVIIWILMTNKYFDVSHRKQYYASSYVSFVISFYYFEYYPCGIFEGIEHSQEVEAIASNIFHHLQGWDTK